MIPIRCIACGEAAQIDEAWLGQLVECPHCRQPTPATLAPLPPSGPPAVPPPPPPPATERVPRPEPADVVIEPKPAAPKQPEAKPVEPAPRAPLTRTERLAIRRRRQLIVAFSGGVILIAALFALLSLRS